MNNFWKNFIAENVLQTNELVASLFELFPITYFCTCDTLKAFA
jgi:hypothetical protein